MERGQTVHGYRIYLVTWFWLAVLTVLALSVHYVSMPKGITALLLTIISMAKIGLIAAFFMHLKFEKLNLVMITITPLILAVILWFLIAPDTSDTARRTLTLVGSR